ncbi:MAG: WXG100 family type VII secretion target [Defluviitaleaceae bacterium]|nr:WXG100 family type VII secretion target [Defluviitaleaceae bacterium]
MQPLLRWNVDALRNAVGSLRNERGNLQASRNDLQSQLTRIGTNWRSPAGRQYQNRLTTDIRVLDNILRQLDRRIDSINRVITQYVNAEAQIKSRALHLPR